MNKIFVILFLLSSSSLFAEDTLVGNKFICPKLFWGFDFFSSNRVKVIDTDINNNTNIREYFYDTDLELSYINIYLNENNIRDRVYSIELNTLKVNIWTMTSGGNTTREMIPQGLCKIVEIHNIYSHIESLKK